MPSVAYSAYMGLSPEAIWEFVQDMDNWAPFMLGYQGHEKKNETESVWTLRSDVGAMSRLAKFEVVITEWNGPERVAFSLKGINEPVQGAGIVTVKAEGSSEPEPTLPAVVDRDPILFVRLWRRFIGFLVRRSMGAGEVVRKNPVSRSDAQSKLTFELTLESEGPMAPMVNAMISPMLEPMAQQLANKIAGHLEAGHAPEQGAVSAG